VALKYSLRMKNFPSIGHNVYMNFTRDCGKKSDIYPVSRALGFKWNHLHISMSVAYIQRLCPGNPSCLCQQAMDKAMSHMHPSKHILKATQPLHFSHLSGWYNRYTFYWPDHFHLHDAKILKVNIHKVLHAETKMNSSDCDLLNCDTL
jgi:hypothetical protein